MLTVMIATTPGSGAGTAALSVLEALRARGHRVLFLAEPELRTDILQRGGTFVPLSIGSRGTARAALAPGRVRFSDRRVDPVAGGRPLAYLEADWRLILDTIQRERVGVLLADPLLLAAASIALLPRSDRPAVIALGLRPLSLMTADTAPFGLGIIPMEGPLNAVRNTLLNAVFSRFVLRRSLTELQMAVHRLTGVHLRDGLLGLARGFDVWAQLAAPEFEYRQPRRPKNVQFIGHLRPREFGSVPDWWELSENRPIVHLDYEPGTSLHDLVLPAIRGLQKEPLLLVVSGSTPSAVAEALGHQLPANVRVTRALPYSLVLASAGLAITSGDYVRTQYALGAGIPVVAAGVDEDHLETAARVRWAGVGTSLRTNTPSPEMIRVAVQTVLTSAAPRGAAIRLASHMARFVAEETLCDLAESLSTRADVPIAPTSRVTPDP